MAERVGGWGASLGSLKSLADSGSVCEVPWTSSCWELGREPLGWGKVSLDRSLTAGRSGAGLSCTTPSDERKAAGMDWLILGFSFKVIAYSLVMCIREAWVGNATIQDDTAKVQ